MSDQEWAALLEWYAAAGVDLGVSDQPVDRFAAQAELQQARARPAPAAPQAPAQQTPAPAAPFPHPPATSEDEPSPQEAAALAASAETLEALEAAMNGFEGSTLKQRATQLVFADGNPQGRVMLIGEAPGREEDLQGKPFVGRSGQLLDRMLAAIGLDRTMVYIANTVPWRPPGNRTPTPAEIDLCLPFLHRQITLAAPEFIVSLGGPSAKTLIGQPVSITRVRGQWRQIEVAGTAYPLLPTFHPAFLLRQPAQKGLAWRDMLTLKRALQEKQTAS